MTFKCLLSSHLRDQIYSSQTFRTRFIPAEHTSRFQIYFNYTKVSNSNLFQPHKSLTFQARCSVFSALHISDDRTSAAHRDDPEKLGSMDKSCSNMTAGNFTGLMYVCNVGRCPTCHQNISYIPTMSILFSFIDFKMSSFVLQI